MLIRPVVTIAVLTAIAVPASALPVTASGPDTTITRVVRTDPVGDVWAIAEGEEGEWVSAGDAPYADVRRAVVRHRRGSVVIRMSFTDLRRVHPAGYWATIYGPKKFRAALVMAGPGRWKGRRMLVNGQFGTARCRGFTHSIDYADDVVTMQVPRRCLGRPAWVRVSLDNYSFRGEDEESFEELTDNPHNDGHEAGTTRRIYRAG